MFRNVIPVAVFLVLAMTAPTLRAGETNVNPTGTWQWGTNVTFVLKLQGAALTGSVIKQLKQGPVTVAITNGVLRGDEVSFETQTIRQKTAELVTTTYVGKLGSDTIKGTVSFEVSGMSTGSGDWEIKRVKK